MPARPRRRALLTVLSLYPWMVAGLLVVLPVVQPRDGPLALATILSAHLALGAVPFIPLAFDRDSRWLRSALVVLLAISCFRFGAEWLSVPQFGPIPDDARELAVVSWNLEVGGRTGAAVVRGLREAQAEVIALQEVTPAAAAAIEADRELLSRFPYRIVEARPGVLGMAILSAFPILASTSFTSPPGIEATLDLDSQAVTVVNVHPLPGRIEAVTQLRLPVAFDPGGRDGDLRAINARTQRAIDAGNPTMLIGDFNVAPTEPGYAELSRGLRDIHAEVGLGPGWTWRPARLAGTGLGLLRIDMAFAGPGMEPWASHVDCSLAGDHCRLLARVLVRED